MKGMKSFSDLKSALKADFQQIIAQRVIKAVSDENTNKVLKYANSYQLDSKNRFCPEKVQLIMQDVIETSVPDETKYDAGESPKLAIKLSTEIRERVKELQFDRYKLVCVVQVAEKTGQGLLTISQMVWDENRDTCAMFSFENFNLAVTAVVYALYYE